jgi:hypothetical protein
MARKCTMVCTIKNLREMRTTVSRLRRFGSLKPQQEIPKKQQCDISPPQVSIDFSQISSDSPHSSHPTLVIRLILDYSDDPEPYPTQFLQQNPFSLFVECTMGTGSFPGVEGGRGVKLTPHTLLVLRSEKRVVLYLYSP